MADKFMPYKSGDDIYMVRGDHGITTNVVHSAVKHSPTGLEFGYGGSGPADMALNILLMFTTKELAYSLYQQFKWKFIAVPGNPLIIPVKDITNFIDEQKKLYNLQ